MTEDAQQTQADSRSRSWCWVFANAEFSEVHWQLRVAGQPVVLERRPLEVLQYLLRHAGEAVTKDELLAAVWPGRVVVEAVLTNAIGKLRKALGDREQSIIATLPRVGYRLCAPVSRKSAGLWGDVGRLSKEAVVPQRPSWKLEMPLARNESNEVWLARHGRTRQTRVFKFSLTDEGLEVLKQEVSAVHHLHAALGERDDFVHVIDWEFEVTPGFVEYAYAGLSLNRWPEGSGIDGVSLQKRLDLFVSAAESVAAAHSVGLLHRDLKPANLLIEGAGDTARLRVTGFGGHLLKLNQASVSTSSTRSLYWAPEVVAGQSATARSDVYALGVILYQLLVGDFDRPLAPGWEQDIADPLLRHDIADATNGDPERRLDSAASLAERVRTLAKRHEKCDLEATSKVHIAGAKKRLVKQICTPLMIVAMLTMGLVTTAWLLQRVIVAKHMASERCAVTKVQARRTEAAVQFLAKDFISGLVTSAATQQHGLTIRELMGQMAENMNEHFSGDLAARGSMHGALGAAWRMLGEHEKSETHLRLAIRANTAAWGAKNEQTLRMQYELVATLAYAGKFEEAHALLDEADIRAGARLQTESLMALQSSLMRGVLLTPQIKPAEALPALEHAHKLQQSLQPKEVQMGFSIRGNLSDAYLGAGRLEDAESLLRETLANPVYSLGHIGLVSAPVLHMNLARVLVDQSRHARGLPERRMMLTDTEGAMEPGDCQARVNALTLLGMFYPSADCQSGLSLVRRAHAACKVKPGSGGQLCPAIGEVDWSIAEPVAVFAVQEQIVGFSS